MSNVLIYLLSHRSLYMFVDVDEVGYWSIVLESVSVKIRVFTKGVTCAVLKQDGKLPSLVHNCNRSQEYTDTIKYQ